MATWGSGLGSQGDCWDIRFPSVEGIYKDPFESYQQGGVLDGL
jgi:hypothetical protein